MAMTVYVAYTAIYSPEQNKMTTSSLYFPLKRKLITEFFSSTSYLSSSYRYKQLCGFASFSVEKGNLLYFKSIAPTTDTRRGALLFT